MMSLEVVGIITYTIRDVIAVRFVFKSVASGVVALGSSPAAPFGTLMLGKKHFIAVDI